MADDLPPFSAERRDDLGPQPTRNPSACRRTPLLFINLIIYNIPTVFFKYKPVYYF